MTNNLKTFKSNKSKIVFDLTKECGINFEIKYGELCDKHNYIVKEGKKSMLFIPIFLFGIVCLYFSFVNKFLIIFGFVLIFISVFGIFKFNKNDLRIQVRDEYRNLIFNDIISKKFEIIKKRTFLDSEGDYIEDENIDEREELLKHILESSGRKIYSKIIVEFDFTCKIKDKEFDIIKFSNYRRVKDEQKDSYKRAFKGYMIIIPDFVNVELLKNINEKDYVYEKNILYFFVSDHIDDREIDYNVRKLYPNLEKPFEYDNYLKDNYIFYDELSKYINLFIE